MSDIAERRGLRFLSLFAGIGGFDLGLERTGHICVGQVEIDPYCRRVLAKHWPNVPRWGDIKELTGHELPEADLWAAGFPCQPVSIAGRRAAQDDPRWLWPDLWRLASVVRPRWLLLENVPGLLRRGLSDILRDLASGGYDAEWDSLPAAAFGAPHLRDRVFLVAYPASARLQGAGPAGCIWGREKLTREDRWRAEPEVCRVDDGAAGWVDRLRALGNTVVPQVAEHVGKLLAEAAHD